MGPGSTIGKDVLSSIEFKFRRSTNGMRPPPPTYSRQSYTAPTCEFLETTPDGSDVDMVESKTVSPEAAASRDLMKVTCKNLEGKFPELTKGAWWVKFIGEKRGGTARKPFWRRCTKSLATTSKDTCQSYSSRTSFLFPRLPSGKRLASKTLIKAAAGSGSSYSLSSSQ
ncbi:hypothetical protein BDN67DRAFT_453196 [Paxillus ammoniavirescens]|nr:hypothetical protein BDN67DRAFT_453196 [Paxillus ammoniavirescens]